MTITLNLPPETERQLHERAQANGKTVEGFIKELVEREVVGKNKATPAPQAPDQFGEMLEPVRREFDESGMSEEELVHFLTGVRNEARRQHGARTEP